MFMKNYEDVVAALRPKLGEYLQRHGIDTARQFKCINPDHHDSHPSCSIKGNGEETFHCLSCGSAGNIFKAAYYLEKKPLSGPLFLIENIAYLAGLFNIPIELSKPSEEELYQLDMYRAYEIASEYITKAKPGKVVSDELARRGWSPELLSEYGVGTVDSFSGFRDHLKMHFNAKYLDGIDLGNRMIYDENNIIFTIKDEYGRPVGFAARRLEQEGKRTGPKYINSGPTCAIYQKSKRLYGLDRVLEKREKSKTEQILVFEGYSDVLTARQHNIRNCTAICGSELSLDQLYLLKEHNYYNIIMCLDGDVAGQTHTAKALDNVFGGHKDVNVKIVVMPQEEDPDSFIRENGEEAFRALKIWDAFEWRLSKFDDTADSETVCNSMIPLIINEPNYIKQETMMTTLAANTNVELKTIQAEVNRQQNERERRKSLERDDIFAKLTHSIQRNPEDAEMALAVAETSLYDLMRQYNEDNLSEESCLARIESQKRKEEEKSDQFSGFVLGEDFADFQNALNGEWKSDVFCLVGGRANSGKTSFLTRLATAIASHPEENNSCVIYHTIDDTAGQLLPKFISVLEGSKQLQINQVANPNFYIKQGADISERRDVGYGILSDMVRTGRLVIKDANDGQSLAFVESLMRYYREKYRDRTLVYVLDNFHKLRDLADASAGREMYRAMSQKMKYLAGKYHCCVICTVEYRKFAAGDRPTNQELSETTQLEYDANLVLHVYNEMHEKGDQAQDFHVSPKGDQLVKMPRIEINFGKNKITDFKNKLFFDFFPASSDFVGVPFDIVVKQREDQKEKKGDDDGEYPSFLK
jgi:DNA primase